MHVLLADLIVINDHAELHALIDLHLYTPKYVLEPMICAW